ncbi:low molecular weight phosphatase family protein [Brachybacterium sp. YJGR34]|uniref:arsenate reductase/protein-tyrosine-phosphatase family protein n=1 Tax=Brachybacterium sp. YJGR34 TaxID=2059911 RepID=UPI0013001F21|nr:low molecular weight phosphatase family protein [Brachybacterium sp. YJGR34]
MVCTANICRSPVAAALLGDALTGSGLTVTSAGTRALAGAPTVPEALEYVARRTDVAPSLRATPLTAARTLGVGLVLTMTGAQRAEVVRTAPAMLRRVLTLRQLVRVAPHLPSDARFGSVQECAEALARCRPLAPPAAPGEDDIADPFGGPPAGYAQSFDLIARSCSLAAEVLLSTVSAGTHGSGRG